MADLDLTQAVKAATGIRFGEPWDPWGLQPDEAQAVLEAALPALRAQIAADIREAVGARVRHQGGSAGVYERSPAGRSTELWSYSNAVAYSGAVDEVLALVTRGEA